MRFSDSTSVRHALFIVAPLLIGQTAFAQPTPVHEYRFSNSGRDSSGTGDGSVGQNVTFTSAAVPAGLGRAMVVGTNGTAPNNVVRVLNDDLIDFGAGDFSIAFWVRRDNIDTGNNDGIGDALNGSGRGWQINFTSSDVVRVRLDDDNGATGNFDSTTVITDSAWHHYLVSVDRDDAGGLKWYIDGTLDATLDPTSIPANIDPNQAIWIGGTNDSGSQGLEGQMALFQIFDSALTADDAETLAAIGLPIHQYDFEGDGLDNAGAANGTVGSQVQFSDAGAPVELGQAAVFSDDGTAPDRIIEVGVNDLTPFGAGSFSISMWVKRDGNGNANEGILDYLDSASGIQIQFLGANDMLRARIDDDLGNQIAFESNTAITDFGWHHLLLVLDRDSAMDGLRWYIDGQLDSTGDAAQIPGAIIADQNLFIGTISDNGLEGRLAQLVLFDRALTDDDAFDLADLDGDGFENAIDNCDGDDVSCILPAGVICVWPLAPGAEDGSNWFNAYRDLKSALTAATPGSEIWVAAGTYFPDGGFQPTNGAFVAGTGVRDDAFQLQSDVAIYGGFTGLESMRDQRDWQTYETILSGDIDGDGTSSGNSFHVVRGDATDDATARLDGFAIIGGTANGNPSNSNHIGGGLLNTGSPSIAHCDFMDNLCGSGGGGAVYTSGGAPTFEDCSFTDNVSGGAAGAIFDLGGATFIRCTISGNSSLGGGGGLILSNNNSTLIRCDIYENSAPLGGGIFIDASPVLIECRIMGNSAEDEGGGVRTQGSPVFRQCLFSGNTSNSEFFGGGGLLSAGNGSQPVLVQSTFSENIAQADGGGLRIDAGSVVLDNCILWQNSDAGGIDASAQISGSATVMYTCIQDTDPNDASIPRGGAANGNIDDDPLFADPDGADNILGTPDDDLTLLSGSPCIDAADSGALPGEIISDLAGNVRLVDDPAMPGTGIGACAIVDMGAYEYQAPGGDADSDGDGTCDAVDLCPGFDDALDADMDGAPDDCDVCPGVDDTLDADMDGVPDDCDVCPGFDDNADSDGDGIPDGCESPCGSLNFGDVDGNGSLDISDVAVFAGIVVDPTTATGDTICAADINEDGNVDGRDLQGFVALILAP